MLTKSLLISLILVTTSLGINHVFAQTPSNLDLTVTPVFFDYSAKPGDTIKDKIRIRNNTSSPISLKVEINKLGPDKDGNLTLVDKKSEDTYLNWVKFGSDKLTARAREWTDLAFSLSIPQDAAFGYYLAISVKKDSDIASGNNAATVTGAAAIPILLNIKKDGAITRGELIEFKPKSFINEYLPVEFVVKVSNQGNVHIKPRGNIFINGQGSKDLGILDVNGSLGSVLPNVTRTFEASWSDGFLVREPILEDNQPKLDKNGKPVTRLSAHWDKLTHFRIGPFSANMLLVFDDGKKDVTLEGSTSFWVLPYKIIGLILVSIIGLILAVRWMLRSYVRSQLRKYR